MSAPTALEQAHEINRLHDEVLRRTDESQKCLRAALVAAWQAGQLLLAEQERVRRTMGAAWGLWLETHFRGSRRTAQNYIHLAETVDDVSLLGGMSLRQVYLRLGIATEPKSRGNPVEVQMLPPHVRLANRLLAALKPCSFFRTTSPEQREAYRQDLRALYDRLRPIFEQGSADVAAPVRSNRRES